MNISAIVQILLYFEIVRARVQLNFGLEGSTIAHLPNVGLIEAFNHGHCSCFVALVAIRLRNQDLHRNSRCRNDIASQVNNSTIDFDLLLFVKDVHLMTSVVDFG